MTSSVSISNRQKRHPIDVKFWQKTTEKLFAQVCSNLADNLPTQIDEESLKSISEMGSINLTVVSNDKIRKLNNEWRHNDKSTDVLSFPLLVDEEGYVELPPFMVEDSLEVGDIVISAEKAFAQAAEYGHSFEREFAFLFVHGLLHVLGFDHETPEDEKEMFGRQNAVLDAAGFPRGSVTASS